MAREGLEQTAAERARRRAVLDEWEARDHPGLTPEERVRRHAHLVEWAAQPADRPELTAEERRFFGIGIAQWWGPASCTEEMAVALGFAGVHQLHDEIGPLQRQMESGGPLPARDWHRLLLALEVVFASDVVGAGSDWVVATGYTDEHSLALLRSIQAKVLWAFGGGSLVGTRPSDLPS